MSTSERRIQRLSNFTKVISLLETACTTKIEDARDIAGIIQFYEMAIELSWKCLKDYLLAQDYEDPVSPKSTIKFALTQGFVSETDAELWLEGLSLRNLTSHTYDEATAMTIALKIKTDFLPLLTQILSRLSQL